MHRCAGTSGSTLFALAIKGLFTEERQITFYVIPSFTISSCKLTINHYSGTLNLMVNVKGNHFGFHELIDIRQKVFGTDIVLKNL
jgi:hypothetical protein